MSQQSRELPPMEEEPVVLEFPDRFPNGDSIELQPEPRTPPSAGGVIGFLIPVMLLAGACLPLFVILRRPAGLTGWVGALALSAVLLWIVASVLWPAHADRGCPECGADDLERLDPERTHGVRCSSCGWSDEERSSWLLAEEEGRPLEPTVLRERGRASSVLPKSGSPDVDTGRVRD